MKIIGLAILGVSFITWGDGSGVVASAVAPGSPASAASLLAGPAILGAWLYIRRRQL